MSNWKLKSEKNIKGAELLIRNSLCSSSVHCSYYSNVQLMLHILFTDIGKSESEIESDAKQGSIDENGYHNWLKNTITRELITRDFMIVRDFNNFLGQLKALRVKGDYKNSIINERKATDAVGFSKIIKEILEEKFSI
jgi:uncharacterized protein (UPF0332 family)